MKQFIAKGELVMKNVFIDRMNEKDVERFTSDFGLRVRRMTDKGFKKACNVFTGANILRDNSGVGMSDDDYFASLSLERIPLSNYDIQPGKNNIILERYPQLLNDESYIFVCNHTCPEDIETVLNVLDRNAYLVLGSVDTLKYNPEAYLLWLNGMIPFDIMDSKQREDLMKKMERVVQTNSILIFPEGSHNYSPNKLVNKLFDGPVNLSLRTGKKIVPVTLLRDQEENVSYIDVGNPINLDEFGIGREDYQGPDAEKKYVNALTACLRDKMATAVYHMLPRHFDELERGLYSDLEERLRQEKIRHAFEMLKWDKDVFDAEYLVKKSKEDRDFEEVVTTLSELQYPESVLRNTGLNSRDYILLDEDLKRKDVASAMREYWRSLGSPDSKKAYVKKK